VVALDRYGRVVGKVLLSGEDVNLGQIKAGLAWHYKKYEREQSVEDRALYAAAEVLAREAKRGLWVEPEPLDFIAKLAALVPKPRVNLTRFARIIPDTHPLRGPAKAVQIHSR